MQNIGLYVLNMIEWIQFINATVFKIRNNV